MFLYIDQYGFLDLLEAIGAQLCRAKQNDEMVTKVYNSISKHLGWNRPEDVKTVQNVMDYLLEMLHSEEFKKDLESKSQGRGKFYVYFDFMHCTLFFIPIQYSRLKCNVLFETKLNLQHI